MLEELLFILALILFNGIFAGAEIAVVTMRQSRVNELAESGSRAGLALRELRGNPEAFLSTVQIGITVVGASAAALGGASFTEKLVPLIERVPLLAPRAEVLALTLVVALISFLSIVLGELVPKSLALRASEGYARIAATPLLWLSWIVRPAVWFLVKSSNLVLRAFGDTTSFTESRHSLEELRGLVDEASQHGSLPEEAGDIASRALEFAELRASDVMIHRRFVVGISEDADAAAVRKVMLENGHRRTPVFRGSLDHVVGYVSWRDMLQRVWDGVAIDLQQMIRPCTFVPESAPAPELLETMRSQRLSLVVVVDEHGGMSGILTVEDLLEELVGEIVSEHDPAPTNLVQHQADGSALIPGTVAIRDVNRELEIEIDETEEWTTIGGLCIELAGGRIPRTGESFTAGDGSRIEIVEATIRRVRMVRIHPAKPAPVEGSSEQG
jgi:putative hemolysin